MTSASSLSFGNPAARLSLECSRLQDGDFSDTQDAPLQIVQARIVDTNESVGPQCQVSGYIAPQVGFDFRLPISAWNGKLVMMGCGGNCGTFYTDLGVCDEPLRRGYACIVSDMGHKGTAGGAIWAYNNVQAEIDYAYRATHVTALAGKSIAERYYGAEPKKSYHVGCSTGGQQGLVSAEYFPGDFDGIVAGAPSVDLATSSLFLLQAVNVSQGSDNEPILPRPALELLHNAVLAKCDSFDGVADRVINNPRSCRFDPFELVCTPKKQTEKQSCLTETQANAASQIYRGVVSATNEILYPGVSPGSELTWEVYSYPPFRRDIPDRLRYSRLIPDPGPTWNPREFKIDRDYRRLAMMEKLLSASNPDLRSFKASGGKLIVYHGWNDSLAVPEKTIDYYETVERTMGGRKATQDFFRLFMMPGVGHCSGGTVDFLQYLEAWVEGGKPPEGILSGHLAGEQNGGYPHRQLPADASRIAFTGPLFAYPRYAMYKGSGRVDDAKNYYAKE